MSRKEGEETIHESVRRPQSDFAAAPPQSPSFLDRPLPIAGVLLLADAGVSLLWALAAGEPRVLVRALFDVIFGVGLLRSRESSRTWAMIRAGIWLVYSFQGLSHGKVEALVDIALAALFLLSMLGLLVGAPSRSRVVGAIAAFGLYAFVTLAFVALVALGHLLGA